MFGNQFFQVNNILCMPYEGERNPVDFQIEHKVGILDIFFR